MTFEWSTDGEWEFLYHLVAWFFWSIAAAGLEWLEGAFGTLPVSGTEGIALAVVVGVGLLWVMIRLIKMLAFLSSVVVIGALAIRFVAL